MAQGLQVWAANGVLEIDITTRLTKILGSFTIGTASTSGSISINLSDLKGQTFWYNVIATGGLNTTTFGPNVTYSNGVFSWSWFAVPLARRAPVRITYGVR